VLRARAVPLAVVVVLAAACARHPGGRRHRRRVRHRNGVAARQHRRAATLTGDAGRAGSTLWDPVVGDEQHLDGGVVWTDDHLILPWSAEGWQVVDVR